ncbi:reductase [Actinorhabdospora filicis]|uniref:Reductase n=1 Tax=Actinorhabdospora filicis TaxID=1785913 RepID=A0A9W6SG18_9ACTN|nr:NAD-dependent epimerase/dehydratase family protein [Actinorhabdospora filicis]GLZ75212.1 reductase [Actinorhabdospora filicis]
MRLLVLGGTVYLSRAVAELAAARGHDVTVATRGRNGEPPSGTEHVIADRATVDGLSALRGRAFDAVVDVAWIPAHVKNAIEVLGEGAGHWTHVSSCSAYSDDATPGQTPATGPTHDPAPYDADEVDAERFGPYKVACENQVRERFGDRALVIRPGLIIGPGDRIDRVGHWFRRIAEGGEILAPGAPEETVQWIDVRDLAAWIVDAAEKRLAGVFDAICPPVTRGEWLSSIAAAYGVEATFTWVSRELLDEHGVQPWMGEESLGLWLPLPEYAGFMKRDVTASLAAGMTNRPIGDTALAWREWDTPGHPLRAGVSRQKEAEVLAAHHARE